MRGPASRWGIPIVTLLSIIALTYLILHSWNIRLTRQLVESEKRRRLAFERAESLEIELKKLVSFSRLESLVVNAPQLPEVVTYLQGETIPGIIRVASGRGH